MNHGSYGVPLKRVSCGPSAWRPARSCARVAQQLVPSDDDLRREIVIDLCDVGLVQLELED